MLDGLGEWAEVVGEPTRIYEWCPPSAGSPAIGRGGVRTEGVRFLCKRWFVVCVKGSDGPAPPSTFSPTDDGGWLRGLSGNPLRYGGQWIGSDDAGTGNCNRCGPDGAKGGHYLVTFPPLSAQHSSPGRAPDRYFAEFRRTATPWGPPPPRVRAVVDSAF